MGLIFIHDGTWCASTFSLHVTATTVMKNCEMFQKQLALHETIYCFQSSEALGGFWSFLKLYVYIQIEIFMYTIMSCKKRRAKYQTEMLSGIAKQLFRYKKCFQRNNTLTVDTNDQKFNCYNAEGHSQTGNRKKMLASWIRKTNRKNKSNEKRLETVFTHRRSNIYLHKLPFIVDLTDIKS